MSYNTRAGKGLRKDEENPWKGGGREEGQMVMVAAAAYQCVVTFDISPHIHGFLNDLKKYIKI